ncbi:hypothetical protein [Rhodococcus sp. 27YEA15]|uniref:hypothetical protein n=1 Tax=Rhodococcus sp. 27YEA15 TaxID=3156259 RepID=UPI003C7B5010
MAPPFPAFGTCADVTGRHHIQCLGKVAALIDAVVVAAREDADTARSLYAFILLGARTDHQICRIDDTFNELGIDIGNHDRRRPPPQLYSQAGSVFDVEIIENGHARVAL